MNNNAELKVGITIYKFLNERYIAWIPDGDMSALRSLRSVMEKYRDNEVGTFMFTIPENFNHLKFLSDVASASSKIVVTDLRSDWGGLCQARFNYFEYPSSPGKVQFINMSRAPLFTSGQGTPVSFLWDFGDGTTSTDPSPVHTYANAGTYNVTLVMTYAGGPCGEVTCTDTFSMRVSISASCYANFSVDAPPGQSYVTLTDYSTTNCPGGISKWIVDWGDGTVDTFTALKGQITHAYSHEGYYRVKVFIEDKCGYSDIRYNIVYVKKCCLPWDTRKDKFYFGSNNKYYLKAKFILRGSLSILSHVAAKSTLYRKSRGRYVRARANTIKAAFNGYVWKNLITYDSNQDCYSIDRVQWSKSKKFRSSVTVSQYKPFNWWYGIQARYRSILGSHYVVKGGNSKLVNWYIHEMQC